MPVQKLSVVAALCIATSALLLASFALSIASVGDIGYAAVEVGAQPIGQVAAGTPGPAISRWLSTGAGYRDAWQPLAPPDPRVAPGDSAVALAGPYSATLSVGQQASFVLAFGNNGSTSWSSTQDNYAVAEHTTSTALALPAACDPTPPGYYCAGEVVFAGLTTPGTYYHTWQMYHDGWFGETISITITIVPASPTPTSTPSPTATPTRTPTSLPCGVPRPPVSVAVVPSGAGRLLATITTSTNGSTLVNRLQSVQLTSATGALVQDLSGNTLSLPFSPSLPLGATSYSFYIRQASAGVTATVYVTVVDACGPWQTFVGGGAAAFATPTSTTPVATPGVGVRGYVRLNSATGAGLPGVVVNLGLASYPTPVTTATTNADGFYEMPFVYIPGTELVRVWPVLTGYSFDPPEYAWSHQPGLELVVRDFVAHAGSAPLGAAVTATGTPTPAAACAPRPSIGVATTTLGAGRLQVVVTAPSIANDRLVALRFGAATNARIEAPGQNGSGGFSVSLPPGTQQATFVVQRVADGQAVTVPLTVVDSCGEWPTVVGGGPAAF
jgi:hypothetical protein